MIKASRLFQRVILLILLLLLVFTSGISNVNAHMGSGPPFIKVNDEYAQTSPLIIGFPDSKLGIAQDSIKENPVTGSAIRFSLETDKLAMDSDLQKSAVYHWTWGDGSPSSVGTNLTHTYTKDGSYLIIVNMTLPQQDSSIVLDTIQINSVPTKNYIVPKPHIELPDIVEINKPLRLNYSIIKQKETAISEQIWKLDNGEYSNEKSPVHTYKSPDSTNIIILRVKDTNGFMGFASVALDATNGVVEKKNIDNTGNLISQAAETQRSFMYYGGIGFILLCIFVFYVSRRDHTKRSL